MKNILCKLGRHKADKYRYATFFYKNGKHKWRRNYAICRRCGKVMYAISLNKGGADYEPTEA